MDRAGLGALLRPRTLLRLLHSEAGRKVIRYCMVSVVGVVVTQVSLIVLYALLGVPAAWANIGAVCISALPCYVLSRSWVWGKGGRNHLFKEVVPFWAFAFAGLVISTVLVHWVHQHTKSFVWINAANLAGFGVLWLGRFLVFDRLVWGPHHHTPYEEDLEAAAARVE